ncbi:hypothetical protein PUN28_007358 [Cardiocondyla obscurior]|uniref:Uncharacterized protein n=1 Tax=Cardiocondyla obscurior TaxID=286306 RepID=A0AAW2G2W0_9HYME
MFSSQKRKGIVRKRVEVGATENVSLRQRQLIIPARKFTFRLYNSLLQQNIKLCTLRRYVKRMKHLWCINYCFISHVTHVTTCSAR